MADNQTTPYLVLARKYRPRDFSTLVGQDAMVQTLGNAFAQNRSLQARHVRPSEPTKTKAHRADGQEITPRNPAHLLQGQLSGQAQFQILTAALVIAALPKYA